MHRLTFTTTSFRDSEAALQESGGVAGRALAERLRLELENIGAKTDPTDAMRGGWKFYAYVGGEEYVFTTAVRPKPGEAGLRIGVVTIDKRGGILGRFLKRSGMEEDNALTGFIGDYLESRTDVEDLAIET